MCDVKVERKKLEKEMSGLGLDMDDKDDVSSVLCFRLPARCGASASVM